MKAHHAPRMAVLKAREGSDLDLLMRAASRLLEAATNEADLLEMAASLLGAHFGYGSCGVLLRDPACDELYLASAVGPAADDPAVRGRRLRIGEGIVGRAALERHSINVPDARRDPRAVSRVPGTVSLLCAPMVAGEELLGVIVADRPEPAAFTERDEQLLTAFAQIVALALTHARAHEGRRQDVETIRTQYLELEAVHEVTERAAGLDPQKTLDAAVQSFNRLATADSTGIYLWSEEEQALSLAALAFDARLYPPDYEVRARASRLRLGQGLVGWTAQQREALLIDDVARDGRARPITGISMENKSAILVPIVAEQRLLGVIRAVKMGVGSFHEEHLRFAKTLASAVSLALTVASAHREQAHRINELAILHEVTQYAAKLDLDATLQASADALRRLTGADSAGVYLVARDGEQIELAALSFDPAQYPPDYPERMRHRPRRIGEGLVGWVAEHREAALIEDVSQDARPRRFETGPYSSQSGVLAPLIAEGRLLGVCRAMSRAPRSFTQEHVRITTTLANSVALTIAAAAAHRERADRIDELARLHRTSARLAEARTVEEAMRAVVDGAVAVTESEAGLIQRLTAEGEPVTVAATPTIDVAAMSSRDARHRTTRRMIETDEVVIVADTRAEGRMRWAQQAGLLSVVGVPLRSEGRTIGSLYVAHSKRNFFSTEHVRRLEVLATQAASALARAEAFEERAERIAELAALHQASLALAEAATMEEAMDALLRGAIDVAGAQAGIIWRRGADGTISLAAARGLDGAAISQHRPGPKGLTAELLATGRPIILADLHDEPGRPAWKVAVPHLHSLLGMPLRSEGTMYGSLIVLHSDRDRFRPADARHLEVLAAQGGTVLGRAGAFEEARRAAITDELTGFFNARHFSTRLAEEIKRAERYGHPLALIMFDSDSLKMVNDRFGHEEGNRHLVELARAIREHVRSTDIVARFGGDEFLVLQPETDQASAMTTAERIREAIHSRSFTSPSGEVMKVSVSAGVAGFPEAATSADELFKQADLAMYVAKRQGKNYVAPAPARRTS